MSSADDIPQVVDHLFRHSAGQMVATLTRVFGFHNLQLAEDVVQDVLIAALRQWPTHGVPHNPRAWLFQAARNRAIDVIRRQQRFDDKAHLLAEWAEPEPAPQLLGDDQLTMMLLCCHPALGHAAQIALTLNIVGGFGAPEIASALLTPEPTVAQRLVRAKRTLRALPLPFALPPEREIGVRRDALLTVIYLLFSEGYAASRGDSAIRQDLVGEALRLGEILAGHAATASPTTHALLALMWFGAARLETRQDSDGDLLLLEEQDRSLWDREAIGRGMWHLERAGSGDVLTIYHLQAGIAAYHVISPSVAATDWRAILLSYDRLAQIDRSPVVALNRAVALAQVEGAAAGLAAIEMLAADAQFRRYPLLFATRGVLHARSGQREQAVADLRAAIALTSSPSLRRMFERRLAEVGDGVISSSTASSGGVEA